MKAKLTKNALKHVMKSEARRSINEIGEEYFNICHMSYYRLIAKSLNNIDEITVINYDCNNELINYMEVIEDIDEMEEGKLYVMLFDGYVSVFDLTTNKQSVMIKEEDFFSLINPFILNEFLGNKFQHKEKMKRIKI